MRELPHGWTWRRVGEVGEVQLGRQRSPGQMIGTHLRPYLRVANVYDGFIDYSDMLEMNFTPAELEAYELAPGDILLNEGQSLELVGRSAIYDGPPGICFQNTLIRFRPVGVVAKFAQAVFKHWLDKGKFAEVAKQTTSIAHLGGSRFAEMWFPVPPIEEQRRIAEILDTLDFQLLITDLILEKLRRFSQGLVESLLSNVSTEGLPLGKFLAGPPKNGYSPKEIDQWTGFLVLGLGCLTRDGFAPRQLKNIQKSDFAGSAAVLQDGDLLISRANTRDLVGLAGRYRDVGHPCIYPDLMMRLTPNQRCRSDFLELVLRSASSRRQIQAMAQGTSESMVKISGSTLTKLLVHIPDLSEQERILRISAAAEKSIRNEQRKREKLLLLKRGLMEDLLTGRVRVPEAEAILEGL